MDAKGQAALNAKKPAPKGNPFPKPGAMGGEPVPAFLKGAMGRKSGKK